MAGNWTKFAESVKPEPKPIKKETDAQEVMSSSPIQKAQIEAECRKSMTSVKGDKVDSFTKRRMAMMTDETTEASSQMFKEVTEGEAGENIKFAKENYKTQPITTVKVGLKIISKESPEWGFFRIREYYEPSMWILQKWDRPSDTVVKDESELKKFWLQVVS